MRLIIICLAGSLALAGCGETRGQRALTGAGIGAATGAVGAEIIGGNVRGGAFLGGLVGAVVGAATSDSHGKGFYDY